MSDGDRFINNPGSIRTPEERAAAIDRMRQRNREVPRGPRVAAEPAAIPGFRSGLNITLDVSQGRERAVATLHPGLIAVESDLVPVKEPVRLTPDTSNVNWSSQVPATRYYVYIDRGADIWIHPAAQAPRYNPNNFAVQHPQHPDRVLIGQIWWSLQGAPLHAIPVTQPIERLEVTVAAAGHVGVADYYCDGEDDQYEINAAALFLIQTQGGGLVKLTQGPFITPEQVLLRGQNINLVGEGRATYIRADWASVDVGTTTNAAVNLRALAQETDDPDDTGADGTAGEQVRDLEIQYEAEQPVVVIEAAGGQGTGAAATAVVTEGRITAVTVDEGGSGYNTQNPPTVSITGGSGFGATAVAVIGGGGAITAITVTTPGRNYGRQHVFHTGWESTVTTEAGEQEFRSDLGGRLPFIYIGDLDARHDRIGDRRMFTDGTHLYMQRSDGTQWRDIIVLDPNGDAGVNPTIEIWDHLGNKQFDILANPNGSRIVIRDTRSGETTHYRGDEMFTINREGRRIAGWDFSAGLNAAQSIEAGVDVQAQRNLRALTGGLTVRGGIIGSGSRNRLSGDLDVGKKLEVGPDAHNIPDNQVRIDGGTRIHGDLFIQGNATIGGGFNHTLNIPATVKMANTGISWATSLRSLYRQLASFMPRGSWTMLSGAMSAGSDTYTVYGATRVSDTVIEVYSIWNRYNIFGARDLHGPHTWRITERSRTGDNFRMGVSFMRVYSQ